MSDGGKRVQGDSGHVTEAVGVSEGQLQEMIGGDPFEGCVQAEVD